MCLKMLPAKFLLEQLTVIIWYSLINSITHLWWSGRCYCLLPKYLYLTCTWLKKYLMSSKYLYLQMWKSTFTWLKYFEKYLTPTLVVTVATFMLCGLCQFRMLHSDMICSSDQNGAPETICEDVTWHVRQFCLSNISGMSWDITLYQ